MKNTDLYKYLAFFRRFKILDSLCLKSGLRLGWSMLRGNEQLFASKYRLCLPSEAATIVCACRRNGNGWARVENETETIGKYRGK